MVTRTKKIFVGGLSASTTVEDVKNFFSGFGKVSEVWLSMWNFRILGIVLNEDWISLLSLISKN